MISSFFIQIYERFIDLVLAPFYYTDMIWILVPLLASLLIMEVYFSIHKSEELGWNTAFGNSLVLIFVSLDIIRFLYTHGMLKYVTLESALAIAVVLLGFTLTLLTFFHILPKDLAFGISSRLPINMIAYLTIVVIYSGILIDIYTAIAAIILAVLVGTALRIISFLIPESGEIPELESIGKNG